MILPGANPARGASGNFDCDIDYFGDCIALRSTYYSAMNKLVILFEGVKKNE